MYVLSITYQVSSLLIWTRKINKLYNVKNGQPCKYVLSITCQLHNSVKEKVAQDTNIKRTVCSIIACSCKVVLDSYVFHILEYAPRFKKNNCLLGTHHLHFLFLGSANLIHTRTLGSVDQMYFHCYVIRWATAMA
jgi:hypothetical protein